MYTVVTLDSFRDAFYRAGRKEQFSYEGQEALFNHLQKLENDMGEEIELDVIAICCDYVESTIDDALAGTEMRSIEKLRESTEVIEIPGTDRIIYQVF